eukprot:TRINITY_DN13493_c0_g1_i1.p1 TRINITY_DN13493_c0_g1~~TRINITY_DN13493_c0_g1_i1.p1  ORF type:complete len:193 (-),score=35.47 TRINITY_DN13493_c0_g1_i1:39-617(-)
MPSQLFSAILLLLLCCVSFEESKAMKISCEMVSKIQSWENNLSTVEETYLNPAGLLSVGYGHLVSESDAILPHSELPRSRVLDLLVEDIEAAEQCLDSSLEHLHFDENEHGALVSLVYNIGCFNFKSSTLRSKLLLDTATPRNKANICQLFQRWSLVKGMVDSHFKSRRAEECELFFDQSPWTGSCSRDKLV